MTELSKKTIDTIEKYCGNGSGELLKSRIASLDKPVTIANTGVVSSGKSSLYNALIESTDERFKVGAARTTKQRDVEKLTDDVFLVDTPGIDIEDADDEIARRAVLESSIIVMVHNIKMGMLHRNETEWLQSLAESFNSTEEVKDRIIFVCSWIDARQREAEYQRLLDETRKMANEAVGCEVDFYAVSAERFLKGVRANKPKLAELSGIHELREALVRKAAYYAEYYGGKAVMRDIIALCEKHIASLSEEEHKLKLSIDRTTRSINSRFDAQSKEWSSKFGIFKSMHSEYIKVRNEITGKKGELR